MLCMYRKSRLQQLFNQEKRSSRASLRGEGRFIVSRRAPCYSLAKSCWQKKDIFASMFRGLSGGGRSVPRIAESSARQIERDCHAVGRAFFVLQTGSIFSQKAGEHRGNRLSCRQRNNDWQINGSRNIARIKAIAHLFFYCKT